MIYGLPLIAAILWGVFYALMELGMKELSLSTFLLLLATASFSTSIIFHNFLGSEINLTPLQNPKILIMCIGALLAASLADIAIYQSVKLFGATYTSMIEIAYPLFVPIFIWLLSGNHNITAGTVAGGVIIIIGVYVMIYGELNQEETNITKIEVSYKSKET